MGAIWKCLKGVALAAAAPYIWLARITRDLPLGVRFTLAIALQALGLGMIVAADWIAREVTLTLH